MLACFVFRSTQLEELLLERKHQEAVVLIKRVRQFSENIQNATNLGRGVERIFTRVETMAQGMADRLLAEISAANTLTVRQCVCVWEKE